MEAGVVVVMVVAEAAAVVVVEEEAAAAAVKPYSTLKSSCAFSTELNTGPMRYLRSA